MILEIFLKNSFSHKFYFYSNLQNQNQEICMFYKFFPIQYFSFLYYHVSLIMFICLIFLQLDQLEECLQVIRNYVVLESLYH